jgi:hypothetical protein
MSRFERVFPLILKLKKTIDLDSLMYADTRA